MAYLSSTTTSPNVPALVMQSVSVPMSSGATEASVAPRRWIYSSTHLSTEVSVANFFTDGKELGFRVGDQLESRVFASSNEIWSHTVLVVGSTTTDTSSGILIGRSA
jgi:hypothetical protein